MAKGSGGGGRALSKLYDRRASVVMAISEAYRSKPRSERQMFGSNGPSPEQAARYRESVRAYNRTRGSLSRQLRKIDAEIARIRR